MKFESFLPKECPPSEAYTPVDIACYRFVSNNPPGEADFKSHRELFPDKRYSKEKLCQACAWSFFDDIRQMHSIQKRNPGFKAYQIAKGLLKANHGLIQMEQRDFGNHISLWPIQGLSIHGEFAV